MLLIEKRLQGAEAQVNDLQARLNDAINQRKQWETQCNVGILAPRGLCRMNCYMSRSWQTISCLGTSQLERVTRFPMPQHERATRSIIPIRARDHDVQFYNLGKLTAQLYIVNIPLLLLAMYSRIKLCWRMST